MQRCASITLLFLLLLALGAAQPSAASVGRAIARDHVDVVGQLSNHPDVVLDDVLAVSGNRFFMGAQRPGSSGFNNGWAIVDSDLLPSHSAVRSFSPSALDPMAGGITAQGNLAVFMQDWQPSAEGNRGSVLLYDISDPSAPQQIGRYQIALSPQIFENRIFDLVVEGNYGVISAWSTSLNPSAAFEGLITLDLRRPTVRGDDTLPEVARRSHAIGASLGDSLKRDGDRVYTASGPISAREVHVFDIGALPSLVDLGTFVAGNFSLSTPYNETSIVGIRQDPLARAVLVDLSTVGSPQETAIAGDAFWASGQTGELLLAEGSQGHDVLLMLLGAIEGEGVYGIPIGAVDLVNPLGASRLSPLSDGRFAMTDGPDFYLLQHDGWQPRLAAEVNADGWQIDGNPIGANVPVDLDIDVAHEFECNPAGRTVAVDCDATDELVELLIRIYCQDVTLTALHFLVIGGFNPGSFDAAAGILGIRFQLYMACVRNLSDPPPSRGTAALPPLPLTLTQGGLRNQPPPTDITLPLAFETQTATLLASSQDDFSIAYAPNVQRTTVAAHDVADGPLRVVPANAALPAFDVNNGQTFIVTADSVSQLLPERVNVYIPLLQFAP